MEEDQELRFVCKLCNKKYPCGKSLGGHMRSHVVANSAESEEKTPPDPAYGPKKASSSSFAAMNNDSFGIGQQSNYGLRENPRKTWRAVDATCPFPQERVCKQCGKGFQSLKALCGHMACHSDRDKAGLKDDHSWTSENQKLVYDSHSDTEEAEDRILLTRSSSKAKRYKKIVVKSPSFTLANNNGSSSVSEIDGEEQEEVAMCLMLLSRDSGNKGGVNSVVESSDNNSVILETKSSSIDTRTAKMEPTKAINDQEEIPKIGDGNKSSVAQMENSDSGYFLDECVKAESDVSVDGFRRYGSFAENNMPLMRGEDYSTEFRHGLNRNRSYRGEREYGNGGMATNSAKIEPKRRSSYVPENPESYNEYGGAHKRSKYECFNCKKTFQSYQALGGHRPCHKRSSTYYEPRCDSGENSLDDDSTEFVASGKIVESASNQKSSIKYSPSQYATDKKNKGKKNKGHVCPFCNRVFKNGQALGGHKRSHFIGGHDRHSNNHSNNAAKPDLLDLNLPAPEEESNDGNGQFSHW